MEINEFFTWSMLDYTTLTFLISLFVQNSKGGLDTLMNKLSSLLPNDLSIHMPTATYAFSLSFFTLILIDLQAGTFETWNLVLHFFTATVMTFGGKGIYKTFQEDNNK